jgi:hypothetical protein
MKTYRIVTLLSALLITVLTIWVISRQDVGAKEAQSIEAPAP